MKTSATVLLLIVVADMSCAVFRESVEHGCGPSLQSHWQATKGIVIVSPFRRTQNYEQYLQRKRDAIQEYKTDHPEAFKIVENVIADYNRRLEEEMRRYPHVAAHPESRRKWGIEDYQVCIGMPRDTLLILYGSPAKVLKPKEEMGEEIWRYDYSGGTRFEYHVQNGLVVRIVAIGIEPL
jgi:hypothetical protein